MVVSSPRSGSLRLEQPLHLEGQLAERGLEVLDLQLEDRVVEPGLRAETLERLEPPRERRRALRRLREEALDLGAQRRDLLVEGGTRGVAERRGRLGRGVDGDDVEPGGADV